MGNRQIFAWPELCSGTLSGKYVISVEVGNFQFVCPGKVIGIKRITRFYVILESDKRIGIGNYRVAQIDYAHRIPHGRLVCFYYAPMSACVLARVPGFSGLVDGSLSDA